MVKPMLDKTLVNIWMEIIEIEIIGMIAEGHENIDDKTLLKILIYLQHKLID